MTVIKDPGNLTESYSDLAVRMWRETAGLWRGDARDISGGAHPSGWVSGQLWSTTASQWRTHANTAYDSGTWGSGTHWNTHANTAYTGGVWGSGTHWSTEAATRGGAAYDSGVWAVGTLWSTHAATRGAAAYDGGAWGVGTLWSTRYTNLSNGLGASPAVTTANASGSGLGSGYATRATITVPKAGYYMVYAHVTLSTGDHISIRILQGATPVVTQQGIGGTVAGATRAVFYGPVSVAASTQFHVQTDHTNGFDTIGGGSHISAVFIPTTGAP